MASFSTWLNPEFSFFKVLIENFSVEFRIPPAFVQRHQNLMDKIFILKSNMGKSCVVTVKKNEKGYFFGRGWKKFVADHDLKVGHFLIFNFVGDRTFQVVIYDPTCCVKKDTLSKPYKSSSSRAQGDKSNQEMPMKKPNKAGSLNWFAKPEVCDEGKIGANVKVEGRTSTVREITSENGKIRKRKPDELAPATVPNHPFYVRVLKGYHKYSMDVPMGVVRATGLANKTSVVIKDPAGRKWQIDIRGSERQVFLGKGWKDFLEANGVVPGDTCVLHFSKLGIIDVQIHSKMEGIDDGMEEIKIN